MATIKFDNKVAEISFEEGLLQCRLIEGMYPNYESVIPQNNINKMLIDRNLLQSALRRVMPFVDESSKLVKLRIENNNLYLEARDLNFDRSANEMLSCEYTGQPLTIGFNIQSIYEMVQNTVGNEMLLEFSDPSRPGVLTPVEQPENQEMLMLLMPMMLQ